MLSLAVAKERWPFKVPFRITGYTFTESEVVVVTLTRGGMTGRGEAAGVYYRGETAAVLAEQIESVRADIERGIDRMALRERLPPGGARNAIDCALWDLDAKERGMACWRLAGLAPPKPLSTTYTIGADTPDEMARIARGYAPALRLKMKLTGEDDAARVRAVRAARPDAWIGVDANQGYTRATLEGVLPVFVECGVRLIEQPVRIGHDAELEGLGSPIPLAADESVQDLSGIRAAQGLYDIVSIKLDKCGGLTEALLMADEIRRRGMIPMVGCMEGTSLAAAPAFLVAQRCDYVDVDAPMFLARDREPSVIYRDGVIMPPVEGWGLPDWPVKEAAAR